MDQGFDYDGHGIITEYDINPADLYREGREEEIEITAGMEDDQIPISTAGISYTQLPNTTSCTTPNIPSNVNQNTSNTVHQFSTDANQTASTQNNCIAIVPPLRGMVVLSDSEQRSLKPEYTVPKTEYS